MATPPVVNTKGYAYYYSALTGHEVKPTQQRRQTLIVTFITDTVPGAYHDPKDLMNWIAQNPYVDTVTLVE